MTTTIPARTIAEAAALPASATSLTGTEKIPMSGPRTATPNQIRDHVLAAVGNQFAALESPALTGAPTAPTAAPGTNSGQLATTAYVDAGLASHTQSLDRTTDSATRVAMAPAERTQLAALSGHTHAVSTLSDGSGYVRMTDAERSKLSALTANYKGSFATLSAVQSAYPSAAAGDWAVIMLVGENASIAVWDTDVSSWVDIDTAPTGTASQVPFAPAGSIAATNVQAALQELDSEKQPALGFTPVNAANPVLTGRLVGGLGAPSTAGVQDWNDASNCKSGSGPTLLLGNATNGPGPGSYFHVLNFEYGDANYGGGQQITQLAIAYAYPANEMWMRGRYSGTWSAWVRFWTSSTFDPYSKQNALGYTPVNRDGDTMGGRLISSSSGIGSADIGGGNYSDFQVNNNGVGCAAITFLRQGIYAMHLGISIDNKLKWGGVGSGVSYEVWSTGNLNPVKTVNGVGPDGAGNVTAGTAPYSGSGQVAVGDTAMVYLPSGSGMAAYTTRNCASEPVTVKGSGSASGTATIDYGTWRNMGGNTNGYVFLQRVS